MVTAAAIADQLIDDFLLQDHNGIHATILDVATKGELASEVVRALVETIHAASGNFEGLRSVETCLPHFGMSTEQQLDCVKFAEAIIALDGVTCTATLNRWGQYPGKMQTFHIATMLHVLAAVAAGFAGSRKWVVETCLN